MATIKSYTDISQSKKLAEILPLESADNAIVSFGSRESTKNVVMPKKLLDIIIAPFDDIRKTTMCWSLAALLDVLPYPSLHQTKDKRWYCNAEPNRLYFSEHHNNPVDACCEMILKLHELNLL